MTPIPMVRVLDRQVEKAGKTASHRRSLDPSFSFPAFLALSDSVGKMLAGKTKAIELLHGWLKKRKASDAGLH